MSLRHSSLARRAAPIAAVVALLLTTPSPAAAECNPSGADPSFRKAVPYAARVIVGDVIAVKPDDLRPAGGPSYRFTVAVDHVLRGTSAPVIDVNRLETGACVRWLSASTGDRIALALDVGGSDPMIARNTAAWISGTPAEWANYETLTLAEVLDLVQPTAPDTSTLAAGKDTTAPYHLPVALIIAAAWLVASWRLDHLIRLRGF